jgi:hypothetical protein
MLHLVVDGGWRVAGSELGDLPVHQRAMGTE